LYESQVGDTVQLDTQLRESSAWKLLATLLIILYPALRSQIQSVKHSSINSYTAPMAQWHSKGSGAVGRGWQSGGTANIGKDGVKTSHDFVMGLQNCSPRCRGANNWRYAAAVALL